jgi:tetratricopeptide (TPR) repeat protein
MQIKPRLLELLNRARAEEQAMIASLSDDERAATGTLEHWSAKDIVAHNAAWKARMVDRLAAAVADEPPATPDDTDQINAEIFEAHRTQPWSEVLAESDRAYTTLVERTQAMNEDDLVDANRYPRLDGRPAWRGIVGNGYSHPLAHIAQFYVQRGDLERANQMQETAAQLLAQLDESANWRGITVYNLACHYALSGQTEKAIAGLAEALRLNPDLTEWSKQDSDLDSIRQEPAYQLLYQGS